jgi:hypothetical protein
VTEPEPTAPEHRFEDVDLRGALFRHVDLTGARFRDARLEGVVMRGVELVDVTIEGEVVGLRVNGVEVAAYVQEELERRHPELRLMRPNDPDGFREAWSVLEDLWVATVARARSLEPALLHESVDGEWSFVQTLRHLVFAHDSWVRRVMQGDASPWHPLDLPFDGMADQPGVVPRDRDARPSLDEVLALRADGAATMRRVLDDLSETSLGASTEPVTAPGWPPPDRYPVREILLLLLNEEWWHRRFAERDLDALESGTGQNAQT